MRPHPSVPAKHDRYTLDAASTAPHRKEVAVSDAIQTLSDATFDETIGSASTPVLVDFWAEWCGPCKMIAPVLEDIATEQTGKLSIAKLNVDDNPDTARRFEVLSIPTLLVFQDGELKKRVVGAKGKSALLADLAEFIG
jgi:thioredoxin 1